MEKIFLQYGILGAIPLAMAWYIMYLHKQHKKERDEWRAMQEKQLDRMDDITKENNKVIREHTNMVSSLKSIFETRR